MTATQKTAVRTAQAEARMEQIREAARQTVALLPPMSAERRDRLVRRFTEPA